MLYSVAFLGAFAVIPLVHRADQVAGDPSDAVERHFLRVVAHVRVLAVDLYFNA